MAESTPRNLVHRQARRPMPSNYRHFGLNRALLPNPEDFYLKEGIELKGAGPWRDALCPFHTDTRPSMRVHAETGAFRCMACGQGGGDVLAFLRARQQLGFVEAAQALGAWEELA